MRLSRKLVAAVLALLVAYSTGVFAQTAAGVVRGEVVDTSGGVLPGVTVAASAADGRQLATTLTDEVGRFAFTGLPLGPVTIAFQLEGFDSASVEVNIQPGVESWVGERLKLAQFTEQVVVYGKVPPPPPPPPPPLPLPVVEYRPPPAPTVIPVPIEEVESICQPAKPDIAPESIATIRSHRHDAERGIYTKGDELNIDGGSLKGLVVGRNLVVRRLFRANSRVGIDSTGEHTAGLVQIVTANERTSTAIVVHACNELMQGDFLASFRPEVVRTPDPVGAPAFADAARILFGDAGQLLGAPRRSMVIDHGREQGIRVGQRLTIFRSEGPGAIRPFVIGEAVVTSVRADSATIRVERATDAISYGDMAAPQRPSPQAPPVTKISSLPRP